ncbi:LPP20 family lipoprotein [Craterilacuibacter sp. RT1T]|uniref:LPP20 family lipoprotein n=1 Tax=Craterilacuibacter sp. RT1T TaxID=2942211 RepID=UPI0020BEFDF4|nr:LPP20 family lipoprotein [Craterilacuibacter sp. RT1T]MCL6264674.1 LPP20 family lipoprotein [Craterilacuibacter sp. RT1T]
MSIFKPSAAVFLLLSCAACASPAKTTAATPAGWMVVADVPAATGRIANAPTMGQGGVVLGSGYSGPGQDPKVIVQEKIVVKQAPAPLYDALRVRVVGYGAPPVTRSVSSVQQRLLAKRASQLDAYRNIAEQVQGFRLTGSSAVSNLVAVNDIFRVYVDAYLRGVRVISTTLKPDGSAETVAEIVLDEAFYQAYRTALAGQSQQVQRAAEAMPHGPVPAKLSSACSGKSCTWDNNFYMAQ